jgi:hypothetical protein
MVVISGREKVPRFLAPRTIRIYSIVVGLGVHMGRVELMIYQLGNRCNPPILFSLIGGDSRTPHPDKCEDQQQGYLGLMKTQTISGHSVYLDVDSSSHV